LFSTPVQDGGFTRVETLYFPIGVELIQFSSNKEKTALGTKLLGIQHTNLMAGHRCSIMHWLNPKARVAIKNDQLKVIKVVLRLS
jgi:hypothetical protein